MRLASYIREGRSSYGVIVEKGILDLPRHGLGSFLTLRAALEADALRTIPPEVFRRSPDFPLEEVELLPPIPNPDKILCVGVNYHAHLEEMGRSETSHPTLFTRFANTQVGHGQSLVVPRVSSELDFEGELAVVIGKRARHVPRGKALDYVAGFACYHDGSVRDWQRHTSQFTAGKNFLQTGGFGPFLVTRDEVPDPTALTLTLTLNGVEMQRTTTDLMIFNIPTLIEYITTFTELVPGDVIATGTPSGVGSKRSPPIFMKAGDVAEVEISGVGLLRNSVTAEA